MNGIARTPRRTEAACHFRLVLTILAAGLLLASRVEAAKIVDSAKIDKAAVGSSWSEYLLGGPKVWDKVPHPPVTDAVKAEIWKALKTDPGGTALIVQFLLNKQSLDPARFDHYHPNLVRPLARFSTPKTTSTTTTTPATPNTSTGAQELNPPPSTPLTEQPVPEPEAVLLAIGMIGWAVWWRRRLGS